MEGMNSMDAAVAKIASLLTPSTSKTATVPIVVRVVPLTSDDILVSPTPVVCMSTGGVTVSVTYSTSNENSDTDSVD